MRALLTTMILSAAFMSATAQNVSIRAVNVPAPTVFRAIMQKTGKNFIYSSDLLQGMKISVDVKDKSLDKVLRQIFSGTDIEFKIKGKNVMLKRKKRPAPKRRVPSYTVRPSLRLDTAGTMPTMLDELEVISRLEDPAVETPDIGTMKLTSEMVQTTPSIFGEPDIIRTLHTMPGVTENAEGMAGMVVHGGNPDENLYMLDNIPLYQTNHFAGLFSAFNSDIVKHIDFYKSSIPAKYDGRLSSVMDVRTLNGSPGGHHGTARIGLTSGAFSICGPIGKKTSYLFGLRRSWYDILTIPTFAIINAKTDDNITFHYYFTDLNGKLRHKFSDHATGFLNIYFGNDALKIGTHDPWPDMESEPNTQFYGYYSDISNKLHWGNLVAQTGLNYRVNPDMTAEFTAAYTRYFSTMKHTETSRDYEGRDYISQDEWVKSDNNINDWIFRGDFDWKASGNSKVRFGASYVRHSFLPGRTSKELATGTEQVTLRDSTWAYRASELNAYIEDDWKISDKFRVNAGLHASLFNIDRKVKYGFSPRISASYRPTSNYAVKAAYSRTVQYVHQLSQCYLSLPTDQWIPVTGDFKPQTADKISAGGYWQSQSQDWTVSVEAYWKWMHNLIDYRDEYYLMPPMGMWNARLASGKGTAKGVDIMLEKKSGKITGHLSYSLAWADRTFPDRNGGKTFPARFDNRHSINVLVNWNISDRVSLNASWTGHSGNRYTFSPQTWEAPDFTGQNNGWNDEIILKTKVNNYQLPFYHRLDLSCTVRNSRGYWTFSLYNAYCHLNTIGIWRGDKEADVPGHPYERTSVPAFKKIRLLPIIPSISYTWEF